MSKRAISVTLEEPNLVWLRGVTVRSGARSLSQTLDQLIAAARMQGGASAAAARSVVGTIDLSAFDAASHGADRAIRDVFARSLSRPTLRGNTPRFGTKRSPRG